ncbi:MAG: hypothetical protein U0900_02180 [Myxococcota bacterium]|mgnify:CR=1 FL=1
MNHELVLAFPLAIHERREVAQSKADDFLQAARARMTVASMTVDGGECSCSVANLLSDAAELTRAAEARAAGKEITIEREAVPLEVLKDLSHALLFAVEGMGTLDEVELEAVKDLLLALTNGLERHVSGAKRTKKAAA